MKLPPLNALRAFEAAARHNGFVGAAEELHVTRGAISRHVKLLEDHLGAQLFYRHGRGVDLTPTGQRLLPVLSDAFQTIAEEARRITADASELRIICPPATSIRWLIPNFDSFRQQHPEIRVRLTTGFVGGTGFDPLEYDIGFSVTHWPGHRPGLKVQTLFPVLLTPACAPALLGDGTALDHPDKLRNFTLLHETPRREDWKAWLAAYPTDGVSPDSGSEFPNLDNAAKAAVMGAGIVMADLVLTRDELASGALVAPFPDKICPSPHGGVCLLMLEERWDDPKIKAFRDWATALAHQTSPVTL